MKKTVLALIFAAGVAFLCAPQLFAQEDDSSFWEGFFGLTPSEDPTKDDPPFDFDTDPVTKKPVVEEESLVKPGLSDPEVSDKGAVEVPSTESVVEEESLVKSGPSDLGVLDKDIVEVPLTKSVVEKKSLVEPLSMAPTTLKKNMVGISSGDKKQFIDAGDFRDPFLLLRGRRGGTEKVLKPGVTVDGVQFNSYNDSDIFIEKVYRDSRFRIKDVFGKVDHLEGGGCLYCHRGIERISKNHKFRMSHKLNPQKNNFYMPMRWYLKLFGHMKISHC